jgi:hypothetical protein
VCSPCSTTKPLLSLIDDLRAERDWFRDGTINLRYYAFEHVIIKPYNDGVRNERPRAWAATMGAMFNQYPKIKQLSAEEVLAFLEENMPSSAISLPKLEYPDVFTHTNTAEYRATSYARNLRGQASSYRCSRHTRRWLPLTAHVRNDPQSSLTAASASRQTAECTTHCERATASTYFI